MVPNVLEDQSAFKKSGTTRPVTQRHIPEVLTRKYKVNNQSSFLVKSLMGLMLSFGVFGTKSCKNARAGFIICLCVRVTTEKLMN
jgi:hypothetical protein